MRRLGRVRPTPRWYLARRVVTDHDVTEPCSSPICSVVNLLAAAITRLHKDSQSFEHSDEMWTENREAGHAEYRSLRL
jgi:hypothetical protein